MSKPSSYNSQELKGEINKLVEASEAIDRGNDISGSYVKLNKTMDRIQPLLHRQESFIKNFFTQESNVSAENSDSDLRRYVNRISEIAISDIGELLSVGEQYFTIQFKNSWARIRSAFEKELTEEKEQVNKNKIIELLFKILNVKDFMVTSFLKSFMYRKNVLWKDLNIVEQGYVHSEKKAMSKFIEDVRIEKGYIPTKPHFDWMGFGVKGKWTMNKMQNLQINLVDILAITNEEIEQVFQVLRNYANLTVEQREHEDINRNKENVKSLRQEIEDGRNNYFQLQKKYRQAIVKDEKTDVMDLRQKLSSMEEELEEKDAEIKSLKFKFGDSANQINKLRQKVKELEGDLNRLNNQEMKKLKDLEMVQSSLISEFSRIHKKIGNMGAIFQFESDGKKSLAQEILSQEKRIEKLAELLGREKKKGRDMQEEMVRLNSLILELGDKIAHKNRTIEQLKKDIDQSNE